MTWPGAVGPSAGGPVAVGLAVVPAGTANATFWRSIGADVLTPGLDASNAAVIAPLAGAWAIACSMRPDMRRQQHDQLSPSLGLLPGAEEEAQGREPREQPGRP